MTYSISVFVRGMAGDEKLQWGIGTPPNEDDLEPDEPYPNVLEYTVPETVKELTQTTSRWPTRIWFRFYDDGPSRDIFLEDVKIDGKKVDYETTGIWMRTLKDREETWESPPHPFGMYWRMNYILAIKTEEPGPIWNPLDSDFWDVENYAMWIYVGVLVVALSGMAVAAYLAITRAL